MIKKLTLAAVAGIALVACAPTKKPVGIENVKTKIPVIVEKEKGVSIYSLNTAHGQIKVYLPEKPVIRRTFSGRVFALPVGLTEEEKDKNLNYLEGYIVSLIDPNTGKEITSAKIGEVLEAVPEKSSTYPIVIKKGEEYIAKSQVYVSENPVIPEELKKNPIPEYTTDTIVPLKSNSVDGKDFKINPYKIKVSKTGSFPEKEVEEYSFTVPVVAKTPGSFKIRCEPQKSF